MTLSPNERQLLLGLRAGGHVKGGPAAKASDLLSVSDADAISASRQLVALSYAERGHDDERPATLLLRLTHSGVSAADQIHELERPRTLKEKLNSITRSDWIAFAALVISAFGYFKD